MEKVTPLTLFLDVHSFVQQFTKG